MNALDFTEKELGDILKKVDIFPTTIISPFTGKELKKSSIIFDDENNPLSVATFENNREANLEEPVVVLYKGEGERIYKAVL